MRKAILILALLGAIVFGGAFFLSLAKPMLVERAARELLRTEVERRVHEQLDKVSGGRVAGFAQRVLGRSDAQMAQAKEALRGEVSGRVADTVTDMLDEDCECRERLREYAREGQAAKPTSFQGARAQLAARIDAAYASAAQGLLREFRIFTATNALAFALLVVIALVRKRATWHLLLPAVAVVGAVVLVGGLYLFNQDWLHTIVFGDYVGLGYAAWVSGLALLIADILMNGARVTVLILNFLLAAIGTAITVATC